LYKPLAYVALYHGIDAAGWRRQYEAGVAESGIATDLTPYGFHRAEQYGFRVVFAHDAPPARRRVMASLFIKIFGFDVLHAWDNRRSVADADIVWTMTEGEGFAIALLMFLRLVPRKPIINNVVWLLNDWGRGFWYKRKIYQFLSRYMAITVHSSRCLTVARREFKEVRLNLMYFGVNSDVIAPGPSYEAPGGRPLNLIAMGSDKTRDWTTLLDAFGNQPNINLNIVCWRLKESDISQYNNVKLLRITNRSDFVACYRAADIALVTMVENIFSGITSALDAVAAGVPLIASQTGGIPTYFTEDEVCFVPVGDVDALRHAVTASSAQERLAKAERASRRFVDRDYSNDGLARRYCDLSRDLLGLTMAGMPQA
jgi:glycosyltransferase involved in cell wall biosynthesis